MALQQPILSLEGGIVVGAVVYLVGTLTSSVARSFA